MTFHDDRAGRGSRGGKAFSFFVAWRYFFSKKSTAAVNVIALISVAGIALVTAAMVIVLSVFNGFEAFTDTQLSVLSPPFVIERADGAVFSAREVDLPGATPVLSASAVASYEGNGQPLNILGIDSSYLSAVPVAESVFEGRFDLGDETQPGIVLGIGAAALLGTGAGYDSPVRLTLPKRIGRISPVMPQRGFVSKEFGVKGVFRADQKEDETLAYIPIGAMRQLLLYDGDEVSSLAYAPEGGTTLRQLQKLLPEGFVAKDKVRQHPEVYRVLKIEKWVSVLLLFFVLILSLFSLVSTLGMLIIEKREDTSVLSILGARPGVLDDIIILEAWLLSVTGVAFGTLFGTALVLLQDHYGWLKLGTGGAFLLEAYPVELRPLDLLFAAALVLFVGWVSSRLAYHLFRRRSEVTPGRAEG